MMQLNIILNTHQIRLNSECYNLDENKFNFKEGLVLGMVMTDKAQQFYWIQHLTVFIATFK